MFSNIISDNSSMEVDKKSSVINPKTLQNEHGNYPIWMSQRQQRQLKKQKKKKMKLKAKKAKKNWI